MPQPATSSHPLQRLVRCIVWLLLVAVPMYGGTGVLLKMLGPAHRHHQPAVDTRLLVALGSGAAAALDTLRAQSGVHRHAHGPGQAAHSHGLFERHHHSRSEAGVVTIGADADSALAALGSVLLAFAPAPLPVVPLPVATRAVWPHHTTLLPSSRSAPPLERPPRTA